MTRNGFIIKHIIMISWIQIHIFLFLNFFLYTIVNWQYHNISMNLEEICTALSKYVIVVRQNGKNLKQWKKNIVELF